MGYHYTDESRWEQDIKTGNKLAFEYAFNCYYQRLCRYVVSLSATPAEAEDIVQEVFIYFWNNRHQIVITTSFKSYIYKACYYKYIDSYRKIQKDYEKLEALKRRRLMDLERHENPAENPKIARLNKAVQELPPKCKEIFMLSKYKNMMNKDIALRLNISIKTVETQIARAYAHLRKSLT